MPAAQRRLGQLTRHVADASGTVAAVATTKRTASVAASGGVAIVYDVIERDTNQAAAVPGETIVLLHGAGGSAAIWWQNAGALCRAGHRVIQWDNRCFGRSTADLASSFFPRRHFADDLIAVLDQERCESAVLVCQSMGGGPGLPTAVRYPSRVRGVVFCGTRGGLEGHPDDRPQPGKAPAWAVEKGLEGGPLGRHFKREQPDIAAAYAAIGALNSIQPADSALVFDRLFDEVNVTKAELVATCGNGGGGGLACPAMLIVGAEDPNYPAATVHGFAEDVGASTVELLPQVGHSPFYEQPAKFNELVLAFVASLPPA